MKTWAERPTELAYLFNPAFCGWVLREALEGYATVKEGGMPLPLAFLVLPLVLHGPTRAGLPGDLRTRLHPWLQDHPELRVNFAARVKELEPFSREALLFLAERGQLLIDGDGLLSAAGRLRAGRAKPADHSAEMKHCLGKAKFAGRWFASAGEPATVFQMWGVCP